MNVEKRECLLLNDHKREWVIQIVTEEGESILISGLYRPKTYQNMRRKLLRFGNVRIFLCSLANKHIK